MQHANSLVKVVAGAALALTGGLAQAGVITFDGSFYVNNSFTSSASAAIGTTGADDDKGVILKEMGDGASLDITGSDTGATDSLFREGITNASNGPGLTAMTLVGFDIDFKFTFAAGDLDPDPNDQTNLFPSAALSGVSVTQGAVSIVQPTFDSTTTNMVTGSLAITGLSIAPGGNFDALFAWSLLGADGSAPDSAVDFVITNTARFEPIVVVDTPEPATLALLGLGLAGLGAGRRKKA